MSSNWPEDKQDRERKEISMFISAYLRLSHGRQLEVEQKRDKPDYFLKDLLSGDMFGVELTSAYLTDRSVPDEHKKCVEGLSFIPLFHSAEEDA